MSKYRFKDGKLPSVLSKYATEKNPFDENGVEDSLHGAFYSGEESTKVIDNPSKLNEFFNPFEDDEPQKSGVSRLKSLLSSKKDTSAKKPVLEEIDDEYPESIYNFEKIENLEENPDNDEYEMAVPNIEGLYDDEAADEDDNDYEEEFKAKKKKSVLELREYVTRDEREEFIEEYRGASRKALFSVFSALVFTLLLFFLESPAFPHPEWLSTGKFGILYLLLDIQLLLISGVSIFGILKDGALSLFKWSPSKNSITFIVYAFGFLQPLLHLCFNRYDESIMLFGSVASLMGLVSAIARFLDIRREGISFMVSSAPCTKYVSDTLNSDSEEYSLFSQYLSQEPYMVSISKTDFVSDFVATSKLPSSFGDVYKIIIPIIAFISIIFATLSNILSPVPTFSGTLDSLILAIMLTSPLASLFTVTLPFFKGTASLAKRGCTVLGEHSLDECSTTSVISFKDTDAFHEKGININSVKTFGATQIDKAIFTAARVFNLTGGPLKAVFSRSILDPGTSGSSENDAIMQVSTSSITALIDDKKVMLSSKIGVQALGLDCPSDPSDQIFEGTGGRIMYMLIEDEFAAKFYIKYSLGKNFKAILDSFYNIGICMAIKSCDPNLDTEYLTKLLRDPNYPIVVIKLESVNSEAVEAVEEKKATPVVSNTSIPNMLRTFLWCDKCRSIINLNNLVKYISIVLAVIIMAVCLFNAGTTEKLTPLVVMIYQLIWTLPVLATSLFQ